MAAEPLFPTPLHLTRQIHDPIANKTFVLEEYGQGNRLVSVNGAKTSIADYERGELTEIDRDAATYSVTRFEVIAKATPTAAIREDARPALRSAGMRATKLGRNAEFFEAEVESGGMKQRVSVAVDATTTVSREALEVLLGVAYPGTRRPEQEIVMSAAGFHERRGVASNTTTQQQLFALPIEQSMTLDVDGQSIELRTSVVRVGTEAPPADVVSIPPGARLVVSRIVSVQQELERLTQPNAKPNLP
jgi:hypothetical protein